MDVNDVLKANKAVTKRFLEEFKNQHNFAVIDELFDPAAETYLPMDGLPTGPEGQKEIARGIFAAFPDVHVTLDCVTAEGDFVAERHTARATHKGTFMGVPASGKPIYWTENHLYRLKNGRIQQL